MEYGAGVICLYWASKLTLMKIVSGK